MTIKGHKSFFGPTGKFPDGKLSHDDDGELQFGVARSPDGNVHVNFGVAVRWIALPPAIAIDFARALLENANATFTIGEKLQ